MDCGKRGYRILLTVCLILVLGFFLVSYLCPERVCAFNGWSYSQARYRSWSRSAANRPLAVVVAQHQLQTADLMGRPVDLLSHPLAPLKLSFDELVGRPDFQFDIRGSDVMVFLHIQKTGGTAFGRHLVRDLDLEQPCTCKKGRKKCKCLRPSSGGGFWLFSRYSTGWKCGLHADWTELTNCVDSAMDQQERTSSKRRYFYVTLLRDPVNRFLSEFRHVQRGATWKTSRHWCGGRTATPEELPPCFSGEDWRNVQLEDFLACPSNLANNRMTRMLADLTLISCYNRSTMGTHERELIMLASAKENLRRMAFFGICERQRVSQYLFESTFKLHFLEPFDQLNETHSSLALEHISQEHLDRIRKLNHLDMQLYRFADDLLTSRFRKLQHEDPNFEENFKYLGRRKSHPDLSGYD